MTLGGRIKQSREDKNLLQEEVAKLTSVSKTSISHWERGHTKPSGENIIALAAALNVDAGWLITGIRPRRFGTGDNITLVSVPEVALMEISYTNILKLCQKSLRHINTTEGVGDAAFAVEVVDDTMVALGKSRSLHPGTLVIIDPDRPERSGDIVLIKPKVGQAMLKELVIDGRHKMYRAFNESYRVTPAARGDKIMGVAVQSIKRLT